MFSRRITLSLVRGGIDKNTTHEEFNKDMDLLIGKGNDNIDTQTFKTYCDNRRAKAKQQKDEWIIKDLIKRKVKPDGEIYPEDSYSQFLERNKNKDKNKYPYPYPNLSPNSNSENTSDAEKYPYPYPKKAKRKYPAIKNGVVDLNEFLDYLTEYAAFKNMPFNRERVKLLLKTNIWKALLVKEDKLNPLVLVRAEEILHSI